MYHKLLLIKLFKLFHFPFVSLFHFHWLQGIKSKCLTSQPLDSLEFSTPFPLCLPISLQLCPATLSLSIFQVTDDFDVVLKQKLVPRSDRERDGELKLEQSAACSLFRKFYENH